MAHGRWSVVGGWSVGGGFVLRPVKIALATIHFGTKKMQLGGILLQDFTYADELT